MFAVRRVLVCMAAIIAFAGAHHGVGNSPLLKATLGSELHKCYTGSSLINIEVQLTILHVQVSVEVKGGGGLLGGLLGLGGNPNYCRNYAEYHTLSGSHSILELVILGRVLNVCGNYLYFDKYRNGTVFTCNGQTVLRHDRKYGEDVTVHFLEAPLWVPGNSYYNNGNIVAQLVALLCQLLGINLADITGKLGLNLVLVDSLGLDKNEHYSYFKPNFNSPHWAAIANSGSSGAPIAGREMRNNVYKGYPNLAYADQITNVNGDSVPVKHLAGDNYLVNGETYSGKPNEIFSNGRSYGTNGADKASGITGGLLNLGAQDDSLLKGGAGNLLG